MKREFLTRTLTLAFSLTALFLAGCSTTESRITDHPDLFNSLSARDQELVKNGQIRSGMSANAVWLAWGSPEQKTEGEMRGKHTETWIYLNYTTAGYGYGGYGYGYPGPYGYGRFGYGAAIIRTHHHGRFFFYGDPFYDPFYYSYIPPTIAYPAKVVTFTSGRVASFQILTTPYRY